MSRKEREVLCRYFAFVINRTHGATHEPMQGPVAKGVQGAEESPCITATSGPRIRIARYFPCVDFLVQQQSYELQPKCVELWVTSVSTEILPADSKFLDLGLDLVSLVVLNRVEVPPLHCSA